MIKSHTYIIIYIYINATTFRIKTEFIAWMHDVYVATKFQLNFSNKYVSVLSSAKYHFEIIKWFLERKKIAHCKIIYVTEWECIRMHE